MIAFVFPGQGSQKVGMGRALAEAFPVARQTFSEADDALGEPLSRLIWEGPEESLMLTENTQPAILTASIAAFRVLESEGLASNVAFVAGHSLGEYSANVAAGTFSFADALRIVDGGRCRARARGAHEGLALLPLLTLRRLREHGMAEPGPAQVGRHEEAREALTQDHPLAPRRCSDREALRVLLATRRNACVAKVSAINQLKALIVGAPEEPSVSASGEAGGSGESLS